MPVPLQHTAQQRAHARTAYEVIEPLHIVAYLSTAVGHQQREAGLDPATAYVGARALPLGETSAAVVASTFYNFSPDMIGDAWERACRRGLTEVAAVRQRIVAESLGSALAEHADDDTLSALASRMFAVADGLPTAGRPLAAAWAALPRPDDPLQSFWQATAVLREWRGDGHLTVLVQAGLDPVEACVFHEADQPDPTYRRSTLGRDLTRLTRGWDEQAWAEAGDRLRSRGLLDGPDRLSAQGRQLYDAMEEATDDAAAWPDDPARTDALLADLRPLSRAVLRSGVLSGR